MSKTTFVALVALAVLAVAACQNGPTSPSPNSGASTKPVSTGPTTTIGIADFVGTWQATKAEGESVSKPGSRRDLVAEGGTVTLVLEGGQMDSPSNWPRYSITVAMPGAIPGADSGRWIYSHYSIETGYSKYPQIDFYPASLPPDFEYGEVPAFLVSLSGNTLKLWDSGLTFLPFDFGWNDPSGKYSTVLTLEFTRQ